MMQNCHETCYRPWRMLSVAKLTPGQESYYERSVAAGLDDYYAGRGESPGVWVGSGARQLDLEGVVQDGELDEPKLVELFLLQLDGHVVGQRPAVEDEMHNRPGPGTVRAGPADHEQPTRRDVEAEFLLDLTAAALVRRLAMLEDPARQRPVIPVVRLDQQHPAVRASEQRRRGGEHGGQPGVPRGLLGRGEADGNGIRHGHGHDPIRS